MEAGAGCVIETSAGWSIVQLVMMDGNYGVLLIGHENGFDPGAGRNLMELIGRKAGRGRETYFWLQSAPATGWRWLLRSVTNELVAVIAFIHASRKVVCARS